MGYYRRFRCRRSRVDSGSRHHLTTSLTTPRSRYPTTPPPRLRHSPTVASSSPEMTDPQGRVLAEFESSRFDGKRDVFFRERSGFNRPNDKAATLEAPLKDDHTPAFPSIPWNPVENPLYPQVL